MLRKSLIKVNNKKELKEIFNEKRSVVFQI